MGRMDEAVVARIKESVPLEDVVSAAGVVLKRKGRDLVGLCPFHEEKTPSFFVSTVKNLFHCMGCDAGGSVVDFVMMKEGYSFRDALELLQRDYARFFNSAANSVASSSFAKASPFALRASPFGKPSPYALRASGDKSGDMSGDKPEDMQPSSDVSAAGSSSHAGELAEALDWVASFYAEALRDNASARDYLRKRGVWSKDAVSRFGVGVADRSLGKRLREMGADGRRLRELLVRVGIFRDSGHEHFNGCIVFPIRNASGRVTEMYGRRLRDKVHSGVSRHLYLPGPHEGVWNGGSLVGGEPVIICEGIIDALTFWVNGFRNVAACYGKNGLTGEHVARFRQLGIADVIIAFDRDKAGEDGAIKVAKRLGDEGFRCWRVLFPKDMDANGYATHVKPAAKSLGLLLSKLVWLGKGDPPAMPKAAQAGTESCSQGAFRSGADVREAAAKEKWNGVGGKPPAIRLDAATDSSEDGSNAEGAGVVGPRKAGSDADVREDVTDAASSHFSLAASGGDDDGKAAPVEPPPLPSSDVKAVIKGKDVYLTIGDRGYRVRNAVHDPGKNALKVSLFAYRGDAFYVDVLNLYSGYHRGTYAKQASVELGCDEKTVVRDLGKVLLKLEELQQARMDEKDKPVDPLAEMSEEDQREALAFLRDPRLLDHLLVDFEVCGMVGETVNKLAGYLVSVSRKLSKPLGAMILSSSASGKTTTMDAILAFVPPEDLIKYSAITGQALYYKGENDLKHKIIAIVEEEGAEKASYPLKLLLSEGELLIASTGKDSVSGQHATQDYRVSGPVAVFVTSTSVETDEEFQNRCLVMTVDESRAQTKAIHRLQRRSHTLEGLRASRARERIIRKHRNAQRLLRSVAVVNPYADDLTFVDNQTRTRRDQMKYLNLIQAVAFLRQYQKDVKTFDDFGEEVAYIEVELCDIEVANKLAHEVLGRTLDELPPQTRALLLLVFEMVEEQRAKAGMDRCDFRFSRRDVREYTKWSNSQLKIHLKRLEEMEYLLVHRGRRGQSIIYELLYDGNGQDRQPFLMGLLDVERLYGKYGEKKSGSNDQLSGLSQPQVGAKFAPSQTASSGANSLGHNAFGHPEVGGSQKCKRAVGGDTATMPRQGVR